MSKNLQNSYQFVVLYNFSQDLLGPELVSTLRETCTHTVSFLIIRK